MSKLWHTQLFAIPGDVPGDGLSHAFICHSIELLPQMIFSIIIVIITQENRFLVKFL